MSENNFSALEVTCKDNVARIRFTRGDLFNRFDQVQHYEFPLALAQVKSLADVRVLVIEGEGKAFSAGGDFEMIREGNQSRELRQKLTREALDIFELMSSMPFPVVCAAQGAAVGLGATILALADIVVAYRNAKIADPHVQIGLGAGDGGVTAWSHAVGINRAKRFLLTGDTITAEQGYEFGLISDIVDTPELVPEKVDAIAGRIASLPVAAVQGTKRSFNKLAQQYCGAVFELSLSYEMDAMASPDVIAVLDKMSDK